MSANRETRWKTNPLEVRAGNSNEKITYKGVGPPLRKLMVNSHRSIPLLTAANRSPIWTHRRNIAPIFRLTAVNAHMLVFHIIYDDICTEIFRACFFLFHFFFIQYLIPNRPLFLFHCLSPLSRLLFRN